MDARVAAPGPDEALERALLGRVEHVPGRRQPHDGVVVGEDGVAERGGVLGVVDLEVVLLTEQLDRRVTLVDRAVPEARRLGEDEHPEPRAGLIRLEHLHRHALRATGGAVGHGDHGRLGPRRRVGERRVLLRRVLGAVVLEVPAVGQVIVVRVGRGRGEVDLQRARPDGRRRGHVPDHRRRVLRRRRLAARAAVDGEVVEHRGAARAVHAEREQAERRLRQRGVRHRADGLPGRPVVERVLAEVARARLRQAQRHRVVPRRRRGRLRLRLLDGAADLRPQLDPVLDRLPVVGDQVELDVVVVVRRGPAVRPARSRRSGRRPPSSRSPSRRPGPSAG